MQFQAPKGKWERSDFSTQTKEEYYGFLQSHIHILLLSPLLKVFLKRLPLGCFTLDSSLTKNLSNYSRRFEESLQLTFTSHELISALLCVKFPLLVILIFAGHVDSTRVVLLGLIKQNHSLYLYQNNFTQPQA